MFAAYHVNKLNDSLLPALSLKGDPGKSFLAVGVGVEIWKFVEELKCLTETLVTGDELLLPFELTDLLLKPSGVDSLEDPFHDLPV